MARCKAYATSGPRPWARRWPGGARPWHGPLRRAMWLWSLTWCAKWRVLSACAPTAPAPTAKTGRPVAATRAGGPCARPRGPLPERTGGGAMRANSMRWTPGGRAMSCAIIMPVLNEGAALVERLQALQPCARAALRCWWSMAAAPTPPPRGRATGRRCAGGAARPGRTMNAGRGASGAMRCCSCMPTPCCRPMPTRWWRRRCSTTPGAGSMCALMAAPPAASGGLR
jgi:hypothetical protein